MSRSVILFLAANPAGIDDRRLGEECAAIEREIRMTPGRDHFDFRSKWAVDVDELMRHLNDLQPAIIHFTGHGGATGLVLVGDQGQPQSIHPVPLAQMIEAAADRARLVVLNACYSEDQAEALRESVGCAIGMAGTISDDDARTFAVGFYRALGYGRTVGNAYQQALATLAGKNLPGQAQPRCLVRPDVDLGALRFGSRTPEAPQALGPRTVGATSSAAPAARYDLFLAHPPANKSSARLLYDLLQPDVRVFLDERSLHPGDRWDHEIPAAQRASRATVILISSYSDAVWYLGDEVVTAIALHRASPEAHLLLPVLLEPGIALPSSLSHLQAVEAAAMGGLVNVAAWLREHVATVRGQAMPSPIVPFPVVSRQVSGDGARCDHFRVHDRLCQVTDVLFEQIVFHVGIERALIAPRTAPLAERVLDIAQLAALDQALCRRLSAELDRRAPWTRR